MEFFQLFGVFVKKAIFASVNLGAKTYHFIYPFGMTLPKRSFFGENYRYGFNGKEKVDEISGNGNSYDLGARIYSPRLGKMFSPDPREKEYPWQSTYAYYANSPIWQIDYKGEGAPAAPFVAGAALVDAALITTGAVSTGIVLKKTTSGDIELKAEVKDFFTQTLVTGTMMLNQSFEILNTTKDNPGYKERQRRERDAKEAGFKDQTGGKKAIDDNTGTVSPDGTPRLPKNPRDLNDTKIGKGLLIVGGTAIGVRVGMEITNPDPSKDAYESHLEKAQSNSNDSNFNSQETNQGQSNQQNASSLLEKTLDKTLIK